MTEEDRKKLKIYCFQRRLIASQTFGDELIENIKSVFPIIIIRAMRILSLHRNIVPNVKNAEKFMIRLSEKNWKECLEDKDYGTLCAGQSFFKPLAWHYYLPAYLIQRVQRGKFSSSDFCPPSESDFEDEDYIKHWNDWVQKRIDLLTSSQCRIIVDYLEITLKVWAGIEKGYEDKLAPLIFWKENYQKASTKEQI